MTKRPHKASFTIFEDADGYWFVPSEEEANPKLVSKPSGPAYTSKIAACRAALANAVEAGAVELHLHGCGATTSIKKEAKQQGIKPFVYWPSITSRIAPYRTQSNLNTKTQ